MFGYVFLFLCVSFIVSFAGKVYFLVDFSFVFALAFLEFRCVSFVEKRRGWWRSSCCSFSGFWVRVVEKSSFCSGIWG